MAQTLDYRMGHATGPQRGVWSRPDREFLRLTLERWSEWVSTIQLPDGTLRVTLRPARRGILAAAGCLIALIAYVFGSGIFILKTGLDLPIGSVKLLICWPMVGAALLVATIVLALRAAGTRHEMIIEAGNGSLKVDHYIWGDHVVRTYAPHEIERIFVQSPPLAVTLQARRGPVTLGQSAPVALQVALAELCGAALWGPDAMAAHDVALDGDNEVRVRVLVVCGRG